MTLRRDAAARSVCALQDSVCGALAARGRLTPRLPPVPHPRRQTEGATDKDGRSASVWDTFVKSGGKVRGCVLCLVCVSGVCMSRCFRQRLRPASFGSPPESQGRAPYQTALHPCPATPPGARRLHRGRRLRPLQPLQGGCRPHEVPGREELPVRGFSCAFGVLQRASLRCSQRWASHKRWRFRAPSP